MLFDEIFWEAFGQLWVGVDVSPRVRLVWSQSTTIRLAVRVDRQLGPFDLLASLYSCKYFSILVGGLVVSCSTLLVTSRIVVMLDQYRIVLLFVQTYVISVLHGI